VSARAAAALLGAALLLPGCATLGSLVLGPPSSLRVTATAYNALHGQTWGDPRVGAWGDRLAPGTRAIAVSPDLVCLGLVRGTKVRVEGLRGTYRVLDKMPARWRRRIDVFMDVDVEAARRFGRRELEIRWRGPRGSRAPPAVPGCRAS
jgi:3D (Asp-Asp-Asp) domain-containing protein